MLPLKKRDSMIWLLWKDVVVIFVLCSSRFLILGFSSLGGISISWKQSFPRVSDHVL